MVQCILDTINLPPVLPPTHIPTPDTHMSMQTPTYPDNTQIQTEPTQTKPSQH